MGAQAGIDVVPDQESVVSDFGRQQFVALVGWEEHWDCGHCRWEEGKGNPLYFYTLAYTLRDSTL